MNPNTVLTAENWIEAVPYLGDYPVRPHRILNNDSYCAPAGFYEIEDEVYAGFAFQPGWGGVDGEDPIYFHFTDRPALGEVRERIASLLVSSWLVQDRGDAAGFHLGDEPGSIRTPYGVIPASVVFAPSENEDADAPWDNLDAVLRNVDAVLGVDRVTGDAVRAFVEWRLSAPVPPRTRAVFYPREQGGLQVVLYPRHPLRPATDNVTFVWGPDGSPLGGEREEYEEGGFVGLYDAIPVPADEDALTKAVAIYA